MPEIIRIILADDHPIVLAGYQHLLEEERDISILGKASTTTEALKLSQEHEPDILLLDLGLPETTSQDPAHSSPTHSLGGIEVIHEIHKQRLNTRILIATMMDRAPVPQRVMQAGAHGYLVKTEAADELVNAIRTVASGGIYLSPSIAQEISTTANAESSIDDLSKRELEIFILLADGLPAVSIAEKTNLSPKTVHAHRANILRKLNLKNNSDLVRFALACGVMQQ